MVTHSSILAWKIPRTEEPGRLQSMGSQRVRHDWATSLLFDSTGKESACNAGNTGDVGSILGSGRSPEVGNGNPLQCSCLGIFMSRRAWWATVHWVTKSQTQLNTWHAMMSSVYNSNNWTSYIDFWFWRFFFLTFLSLFPFALNILKRDCALSFKFWNLFFFFGRGESFSLFLNAYSCLFGCPFFITLCSWSLDTIFSA